MADRPRARRIRVRGQSLLRDPLLSKGSGFTPEERRQFGLEGLLPPGHLSIEDQAERSYRNLERYPDPLLKYVFLASLQDRNEHVYFRLLRDRLPELLPIVYTPTVGLATQQYSHVFRRGRGVWITPALKGRIAEVLANWADGRDIRLIVATDNESILGIGDQGAGGMAISIGKLALYTAAAGIDPATVLPVSLDVGTGNAQLLADPLYLGWKENRLRGEAYETLLDEFVEAVRKTFPTAMLQWEDFRKDNALRVLDRYADRLPSFNDDIQGTGAVALAGILSAERIHGRDLKDERIVILGAGAAGLGIARQIRAGLAAEGIDEREACHAVAALDRHGLIVDDGGIQDAYKKELAWEPEFARQRGLEKRRDFEAVVDAFEPTVLIGSSGQPGAFSEAIIRAMARQVDRPVIMPLSNPSHLAEARPADLLAWTDGRALVSTGSPFAPVEFDGRRIEIGQGNNAFIFPGVGLATLVGGIRRVTDRLFFAAARALADTVEQQELGSGLLYPRIDRLHEAAQHVACAVIAEAMADELCDLPADTDVEALVEAGRWEPEYLQYLPEGGNTG